MGVCGLIVPLQVHLLTEQPMIPDEKLRLYKGELRPKYVSGTIKELREDEVFVFGSNLEGYHGGGAAYIAFKNFGAVWGQGTGLQGQSYAIPTMQGGVETIKPYVDEFIAFAEEHTELYFYVTRIGCGMAFPHNYLTIRS